MKFIVHFSTIIDASSLQETEEIAEELSELLENQQNVFYAACCDIEEGKK